MLFIDTGPYRYQINGATDDVTQSLIKLYPSSISRTPCIIDYQIDIEHSSFLRKLFRPQVSLSIDGQQPFNPVATSKLLPSVEWAMNWCITASDHTKLLIHCSVVEKNGKAILFPAISGSGKSTTSTYLGLNGWNLFFDEMAVIDLVSGKLTPVFRPSSLKNNSIDIIKPYIKTEVSQYHYNYMSEVTPNTHKGDIAHVRTLSRSAFNRLQPATACAVVFLDYNPKVKFSIYEVDQSIGFSKLVANAFNYSVIGEPAFNVLTKLVSNVEIFEVSYSSLTEISEFLEDIVSD